MISDIGRDKGRLYSSLSRARIRDEISDESTSDFATLNPVKQSIWAVRISNKSSKNRLFNLIGIQGFKSCEGGTA